MGEGEKTVVIVVCEALRPEKGLILALRMLESTGRVVCVHLQGRRKRPKRQTELKKLLSLIDLPVVDIGDEGALELVRTVQQVAEKPLGARVTLAERYARQVARSRLERCVGRQRRRGKLLTVRLAGISLMLLLMGVVLWIAAAGSSLPVHRLHQLLSLSG